MSKAYVFDFDETLVDYDNNPLELFTKFRSLDASGKPLWILTARDSSNLKDVNDIIDDFKLKIKKDKIIAVGPNQVAGQGSAERKAEYLAVLVDMGYSVEFWDDDNRTIKAAKKVNGVIAHKV